MACWLKVLEERGKGVLAVRELRGTIVFRATVLVVDTIVEYFQREAASLERCIPHSIIPVDYAPIWEWPSSCPREAGVLVPNEHHQFRWSNSETRAAIREYHFTNKPSGGRFRVQLVSGVDEPGEGETIWALELYFD